MFKCLVPHSHSRMYQDSGEKYMASLERGACNIFLDKAGLHARDTRINDNLLLLEYLPFSMDHVSMHVLYDRIDIWTKTIYQVKM